MVIIAIEIVFGVVLSVLLMITHFFGFLSALFWPLFVLVIFGLWLYLLISTYQGKTVELPVIGPLARKQAQS